MSDKKKVPKHIEEFYNKDKKINKLIATTEAVHSEAFLKGSEHLRDENGQINYDLLEDTKVQDAFVDKLMDHYISSAVKALGLKSRPKGEFEEDLILQKYIGITRGELRRLVRKHKSNYTQGLHEDLRDNLVKKQRGELLPLRHGHMEDKHIEDILKHTKLGDYVAKDRIDLIKGIGLLDLYKQKGNLGVSDLYTLVNTPEEKGGWESQIYLTDKGKEEVKKLKHAYKNAA